ncbi:MAG: hypothetical protein DMG03_27055 [Acidobacteria bacterium]|nr:MAG: hypothetical protein DMG03_27055 [Acidobacteriota bacterium]
MILVVAFAAEYVQTWTMQLTGQRVMFDLRMSIYGHLQRLDLKYYDRNPVGRLMTRVTSDVDALNDLFTAGVITIFGDVFALAGIMIIMIGMNWRLALVAFSVLPLIVLVTQWFRRSVRESYRVVRGLIARINAFLDANISSIFYYAVFYPAIEAISSLASALIIWYGGGRVMQSALTLGALVAFLQYSQRFFRPLSDMSDKFNVLQSAMASSERIFKLLDEPLEVKTPERPVKRQKPVGHIIFDRVWFAYTDEEYVLQDVSFEVRPGQRVGIVGATGSGKTTLINLLLRFSRSTASTSGRSTSAICAASSASCCRTCICSPAPSPTTSGWATRRSTTTACGTRHARCTPSRSSSGCPAATRARSPSAARRSRSARSSCCRSPARWRSTRAS